MADLTTDEIELLTKALKYYEEKGVMEELVESGISLALKAYLLSRGDMSKANALAQEYSAEHKGGIESLKERITLLRAKLIGLKDKAVADRLDSEGLS